MSQLASDIVAYVAVALVWLPLLLGLLALIVICCIFAFKKWYLQEEYYKKLVGHDRDIIDNYLHVNPFKKRSKYQFDDEKKA